jgi:cytochrome c553
MPRISKLPAMAALRVAVCLFGLTSTATASPSGKDLFAKCVNCHGEQGLGNQMVLAPGIAGLPAWYVETQLNNFKTSVRGYHYDDIAGHRMRPMARMLRSDAEIKAVSKYVSTLSATKPKLTLKGGDAAAGKAAYATCTACHGADGKGNQALGAPDIRFTGDWYLLAQLKKFKAGLRGVHPKDVRGMTMRPMAMALVDEQAMKDVVAYIMTLGK